MTRKFIWKLFFSIWLVYLFHYNPSTAGTDRYVYITTSIVERATLNLDPYLSGDKVTHLGHTYSDANPGIALAAVPAWAIVYNIIPPFSICKNIQIGTCSLLSGALCLCCRDKCCRRSSHGYSPFDVCI